MKTLHKTMASVGILLLALSSVTQTSYAEPQPLEEPYAPRLAEGESQADVEYNSKLEAAAVLIQNLAGGKGYATMLPDPETMRMTVIWKSPVPAAVDAIDGTSVEGFRVHVQPSRLSQDQVLALSDQVLALSRAGAIADVASVTGNSDVSGLQVRVPPAVFNKPTTVKALTDTLTSRLGVPISDVEGMAPVPTTRWNDSDPWYGGGAMTDPFEDDNFCSTGFAAITSSGYGRLLSARHCDSWRFTSSLECDRAWNDGTAVDDLTWGYSFVDCHNRDDTLLIDPVGGTDGWVHGGPWNATSTNSSRYHLKVAGSASPVWSQKVCSSGARSGEHCGLSVVSTMMETWNCPPNTTCRGWDAYDLDRSQPIATISGDSGGPVYQNRTDGRVGARGIIYGGRPISGTSSSICPASYAKPQSGTFCWPVVVFTDIGKVLSNWSGIGLSIEATP